MHCSEYAHIKFILLFSTQVELCVKILSDILELTFRKDIGSTISDVKEIMLTALRTIIQTVISMDRENPLVGNLVSVMLAIFRYRFKIRSIRKMS